MKLHFALSELEARVLAVVLAAACVPTALLSFETAALSRRVRNVTVEPRAPKPAEAALPAPMPIAAAYPSAMSAPATASVGPVVATPAPTRDRRTAPAARPEPRQPNRAALQN